MKFQNTTNKEKIQKASKEKKNRWHKRAEKQNGIEFLNGNTESENGTVP